MDLETFYEKLAEVKDEYKWRVKNGKYIRAYREGFKYCPIEAVFKSNSGAFHIISEFNCPDLSPIIYAADHLIDRQDVTYLNIRNKLLEILGL